MSRRWLTPWFFALILLFGQVSAITHAATHLSKSDSGLPAHTCELCLAQANLGGAAPVALLHAPLCDAIFHWADSTAFNLVETLPPVARARAPPTAV